MGFKYKINDKDLLEVVQGEDLSLALRIMDDAYNPIDLTNATDISLFFERQDGVGVIERKLTNRTFVSSAVDVTNNKITLLSHGLVTNDKLSLTTSSSLPAPLAISTSYYVIVLDADTFQLSASRSGSPIVLTDIGVGTQTMVKSELTLTTNEKLLGLIQVALPDEVTTAMKAGEKLSFEMNYTVSDSDNGTTRYIQMRKALTVYAQIL